MAKAKEPPRVVSLLPSATDIIAVAGAVDMLVGRSHECNWPSRVEKLPILTGAVNQFVDSKQMDDVVKASLDRGEGLYFLEQDLLKELKPDVIVTQDLCNVCSVDLQLVQKTVDQLSIKPTIVTLNPQKLSDVLQDIVKVGTAVGCQQQSEAAVKSLQQRVEAAQQTAKFAANGREPIKVAFVEWLDPLFVGGHWTPEMIKMAGGTHPLNMPLGGGGAGPSIRIPNEALVEADCDWIIVCPCGFTIEDTKKEEHLLSSKPWWQNLRAVKEGRVAIVDGNQMFARPGPRLVEALEFLVGLLHNKHDLIPSDFPWTWWDTHQASDEPLQTSATSQLTSAKAQEGSASRQQNANNPQQASANSQQASDKAAASNGTASNGAADCIAGLSGESSSHSSASTAYADNEGVPADQPDSAAQDGSIPAASKSVGVIQAANGAQDGAGQKQPAAERKWGAAPFLGAEIEDAHAAAIEAGQPTYTDPATGYKVITEQNLRQQSVCCANRCRHCPFGHFKVPASRGPRINSITRPTVLKINRKDSGGGSKTLTLWPGNHARMPVLAAQACINAADLSDQINRKGTQRGGSSSSSTASSSGTHAAEGSDTKACLTHDVYVAAFERQSGRVWGSNSLFLHDTMDSCLQSGHVLVAVPNSHHQQSYSVIEADSVLSTAWSALC